MMDFEECKHGLMLGDFVKCTVPGSKVVYGEVAGFKAELVLIRRKSKKTGLPWYQTFHYSFIKRKLVRGDADD